MLYISLSTHFLNTRYYQLSKEFLHPYDLILIDVTVREVCNQKGDEKLWKAKDYFYEVSYVSLPDYCKPRDISSYIK